MSELYDDLLWGADAIAAEIFGDEKRRNRVYRLPPSWPIFRVNAIKCARRSSLRKHIENLEREAERASRVAKVDVSNTEEQP
jgi:hypothetical protein